MKQETVEPPISGNYAKLDFGDLLAVHCFVLGYLACRANPAEKAR